jgi:hypothetical protein
MADVRCNQRRQLAIFRRASWKLMNALGHALWPTLAIYFGPPVEQSSEPENSDQ